MTTKRELPNDDNPAVNAKGTVNPSDNPMILPVSALLMLEPIYLHIANYFRTDQVPLVIPFEILAALAPAHIISVAPCS